LTTFIATARVEAPLSTALYPDTSSDDFLPSDLQSWQYGVYETGAFFQEVLIDTSVSNNFVVYVRTYGGN
jgi:hypothetical protein